MGSRRSFFDDESRRRTISRGEIFGPRVCRGQGADRPGMLSTHRVGLGENRVHGSHSIMACGNIEASRFPVLNEIAVQPAFRARRSMHRLTTVANSTGRSRSCFRVLAGLQGIWRSLINRARNSVCVQVRKERLRSEFRGIFIVFVAVRHCADRLFCVAPEKNTAEFPNFSCA